MGTTKIFDGQSGRAIGAIASNFPKFSGNVLQHLVEEYSTLTKALTLGLCPVWRGLTAKKIYATELYHFCYGCKVVKSHCPTYKFDILRLQFKTFQHGGEGFITGKERLKRLAESKYIPINPLIFASLTEKRKSFLYAVTEGIREEGLLACDDFIYPEDDNRAPITFSYPGPFLGALKEKKCKCEELEKYFVTLFYNWSESKDRWKVRYGNLDYLLKRPIYSVVIEP